MTIRPQDLLDRRFRVAFRGAARWEVRELLKALAEDYASTLAEVDRLRAELASAGSRLVVARDHEREATRLLSQAEDAARKVRGEAERAAAEATARAEGTLAAMLRELEAERALLDGRIAECLERQQRARALLQAQADELTAFLATEPAFDAGAVNVEPPLPEPRAVECLTLEGPVADGPAAPALDESPFSAAEVSQAFAVATGQHALPLPEAAKGEPDGCAFEGVSEWAAPGSSPERGTLVEPSGPSMGRRFIPAGFAAAVIVSALASPGSSPAPDAAPGGPRPAASAGSAGAPARKAIQTSAGLEAQTAPSVPLAPAAAPQEAPLPAGTLRVTVEAVRPCWIRLTTDGKSLERELNAGEAITRDSTTDAVIRAGNAGALVVTLNGRTLPPLGREGEIVTRRLTLAMAAQ